MALPLIAAIFQYRFILRTKDSSNPTDISNFKLEPELNTETTMNLSQTGDTDYEI